MQVICWVLGEYGTVAGASAGEVMDQLCAITDTQSVSDGVRGFMLTAFSKLVAQSGTRLTPAAQEIVHAAASSVSTDLQQRALELETLCRCAYGADLYGCFLFYLRTVSLLWVKTARRIGIKENDGSKAAIQHPVHARILCIPFQNIRICEGNPPTSARCPCADLIISQCKQYTTC